MSTNATRKLSPAIARAVELTRWADEHATAGCATCTRAVFEVNGRPCLAARDACRELSAISDTFTAADRATYYEASR